MTEDEVEELRRIKTKDRRERISAWLILLSMIFILACLILGNPWLVNIGG